MAYFPLNIGSFCSVIQNVVPSGIWSFYGLDEEKTNTLTQPDTVVLVFSLVYNDFELENINEDIFENARNSAERYFNNKRRLSEGIRKHVCQIKTRLTDVIEKNFRNRIWDKLNDEQREQLLFQLKELVNRLQEDEDPMGLRDYIGVTCAVKGDNDRLCSRFVAKCLKFCLFTPNTPGEVVRWSVLNEYPNLHKHNDPYRLVSGDTGSTVVKWILIDDRGYRRKREYYDYNMLVKTILHENLILKSVVCGLNVIEVCYERFDDSKYQLRRLKGEKDIEKARQYILAHENEFQRKRSWRGRRLSDMAFNGLISHKWNAYGYFDPEGNLIAYSDAKIRLDGNIELGILLVDSKCRGMGLASSLLFFFEIMFAPCRVFGGTYESNKKMRKTFLTTEFVQIMYYDSETKEKTKMIKERINEEYPEDREKDGYSVYYFSESLLTRLFRTTEEMKKKKKDQ